ncbi:hypothetical protein VP01_856g1, partial [Puccinia sorghi]
PHVTCHQVLIDWSCSHKFFRDYVLGKDGKVEGEIAGKYIYGDSIQNLFHLISDVDVISVKRILSKLKLLAWCDPNFKKAPKPNDITSDLAFMQEENIIKQPHFTWIPRFKVLFLFSQIMELLCILGSWILFEGLFLILANSKTPHTQIIPLNLNQFWIIS